MTKSKLGRGYYPIYVNDLRSMISCCRTWDYGNKDICKYVAENSIEQMEMKYGLELDSNKRNGLMSNLISFVHHLNSGRYNNKKELLIKM